MKGFISVSPLKVLEKSSKKGLGSGNLGVLIARAGVGKTACLIHIAFDKIFRQEKLVHISLEEGPEKVTSYYNVIYSDLVKALDLGDDHAYRALIDAGFEILAERQVVMTEVEDRPGATGAVLRLVADSGANIDLAYLAADGRLVLGGPDVNAIARALDS